MCDRCSPGIAHAPDAITKLQAFSCGSKEDGVTRYPKKMLEINVFGHSIERFPKECSHTLRTCIEESERATVKVAKN
ncbi:hypothetical protein V6N13_005745 [Hibiscus sabdariffa]|uniref:Uncharacterized protein n=1 Tax=Hibiscus sabdariffa TaxID=183260 RepID=A0ABR2EPU8_9ROSI